MKPRIMLLTTLVALAACSSEEAALPTVPDDAATPSPTIEAARSYADSKAEHGWFPLDRALVASTTERHRCTVERINGEKPVRGQPIAVEVGAPLAFYGWNSDAALQSPDRFLFVLDGGDHAYALNGTTGRARPDVAAALQSEGPVQAGFHVKSTLAGVAPGSYALKLLGESASRYSLCATPATLVVGRP